MVRLSFRFVIPLVLTLAATAYALIPLADTLTLFFGACAI